LDAPSESTFKDATERMKISTRQYAKRQISWIRNKLIPAVDAANIDENIVPLYLLDATSAYAISIRKTFLIEALALGDDWVKNVQVPAFEIQDGG
jgi:tRNA dimethylallyltransferase